MVAVKLLWYKVAMHRVKHLSNIDLYQDDAHRALWVIFSYDAVPCFSPTVLSDVYKAQRYVMQRTRSQYETEDPNRALFQVIASNTTGSFSLGGDLQYFLHCIETNNRPALLDYARTCIEIQLNTVGHYGVPLSTITVVEGECLGGGFECALASDYLIADENATFGFPELSFGMFPGMGALALLLRKIAPGQARRLLTEQKIYSARELYEIGVVDQLASAGKVRQATRNYMLEQIPRSSGMFGIQKSMDLAIPIVRADFETITEEWVDAAFSLQHSNQRLMRYLARAQSRRSNKMSSPRESTTLPLADQKILAS
jgi:DSF synthase